MFGKKRKGKQESWKQCGKSVRTERLPNGSVLVIVCHKPKGHKGRC